MRYFGPNTAHSRGLSAVLDANAALGLNHPGRGPRLLGLLPKWTQDFDFDGVPALIWMMSEGSNYSASHTNLLNNKDDIECIARLRLRAHNLNVESDRNNPCSSRICRCCATVVDGRRVVEDEMHFMLEFPLYSEDRKLFFVKLGIALQVGC